jgi:hypothetical protein
MDFPCHARLKPASGPDHRLGRPVKIFVGNSIRKVPRPPHTACSFRRHADEGYNLSGRARCGIFRQPHKGGGRHWLLVSWRLDGNASPLPHDEALESEPAPWSIWWAAATISVAAVWDRKGMRLIQTRLTALVLDQIFSHYGDPYGEASWLAGRLSPRRAPAAIRVVNPLHFQLWIKV